jgi:hypothetical protein
MFDPDGHQVQPGEALHRKDVLAVRSNFRPVTRRHEDMFVAGLGAFGGEPEDVLSVAEMTMATVMEDGDRVDNADFLARVDTLTALGYHVLVSDYLRYFRLRAFLRRYTQGRIGIVARLDNLRDIFNPEFYADLDGGLLEAFGRLFCDKTWMYVYPARGADGQLDHGRHLRPEPRRAPHLPAPVRGRPHPAADRLQPGGARHRLAAGAAGAARQRTRLGQAGAAGGGGADPQPGPVRLPGGAGGWLARARVVVEPVDTRAPAKRDCPAFSCRSPCPTTPTNQPRASL